MSAPTTANRLFIDAYSCPICNTTVEDDNASTNTLAFDGPCQKWYHRSCANLSYQEFRNIRTNEDVRWQCPSCTIAASAVALVNQMQTPSPAPVTEMLSESPTSPYPAFRKANTGLTGQCKWGILESYAEIHQTLQGAYDEIVKWKKNFFRIPYGSCGKDVVNELTKLFSLYNSSDPLQGIAIKAVLVLLPLLLQKPTRKSKTKDHRRHLQRRLELWKEGGVNALVKEGKAIQKRLQSSKRSSKVNIARAFSNLVFQGKVGAACKLINSSDGRPIEINRAVIDLLVQKHPEGKDASSEALIEDREPQFVEPIIYEGLDSNMIMKAALQTRGSGGPTKIDADIWRQLMCSKSFMPASEGLCEQVSIFAKHLCNEYADPSCLTEFTACRLLPLDKEPGSLNLKIRPIGIGEVIRRICGKATMMLLKPELVEAAGPLQTCAGLAGGIDAAIHAMRDIFDDENTEGMLLVDANNAFNSLNREASLRNMDKICPEISKYLINTYREPARLFINNANGQYITSEEGSTQGDNAAMNMYACSIKPLIDILSNPSAYQVAGVDRAK